MIFGFGKKKQKEKEHKDKVVQIPLHPPKHMRKFKKCIYVNEMNLLANFKDKDLSNL